MKSMIKLNLRKEDVMWLVFMTFLCQIQVYYLGPIELSRVLYFTIN